MLLWWRAVLQFNGQIALAIFCVLLAGFAAWRSWDRLPSGQLAWDGTVWHWESPSYQTGSADHKLSVIADFQHRLLLRLENQAGASQWLWLEKKAMPERWMDLRRALYSPHRSSDPLPEHDFLFGQASPAEFRELTSSRSVKAQPFSQERS